MCAVENLGPSVSTPYRFMKREAAKPRRDDNNNNNNNEEGDNDFDEGFSSLTVFVAHACRTQLCLPATRYRMDHLIALTLLLDDVSRGRVN